MWINPVHVLRVLQAVLALVAMALSAYVSNWFNTNTTFHDGAPTQFIFLVFVSVWSLLIVLPYTTICPRFFPHLAQKHVMLFAEVSTCLLWLGGFAAAADRLRRFSICRGSVCGSARGGVVLGAFEFVLFAATAAFAFSYVSGRRDKVKDGSRTAKSMGTEMHKGWVGNE